MENWKEQLQNISSEMKSNTNTGKKTLYDVLLEQEDKDIERAIDNLKRNLPQEQWIDTHAHYDYVKFNSVSVRKPLLDELRKNLKYIVNLGTDMKSNTTTLQLVSLYDYIFGMLGFFPTSTYQLEEELCPQGDGRFIFSAKDNLLVFEKQLTNQKIVGIGEIGLDYHWNSVGPRGKDIKGEKAREIQKKWFKKQLDMAKERNLPVSMHSRDAEIDTIEIFNEFETIKGVMHCFSYGMKSADFYLNKGLYLGIGGTSTYPNNKELREVIKNAPLDRLLLETDAPYLSPQPVRREINNSNYITYVIDNIAEIKQITRSEIIEKTNKNAINLFKFKKV